MFERIANWVEVQPAARRALPWISGVLVALGLIVVFSSFGGGGGELVAETEPIAPTNLTKAAEAAREYQAERVPATFEGFNIAVAEGMDSTLSWTKEPPVDGEVQIRVAKSKNLLLISADETGTYCLALDASGAEQTGKVDAEKTGECLGGW